MIEAEGSGPEIVAVIYRPNEIVVVAQVAGGYDAALRIAALPDSSLVGGESAR
jgi:hypothetical protein